MNDDHPSDMQFNCWGKILLVLVIVLKWPNFKLPLLQRGNSLCNGYTACSRSILRNLAHQRGTANFFTVLKALPTFCCVKDKLNIAILDLVDYVRTTLCDLVDALNLYALRQQIVCRAACRTNAEAARNRLTDRRDDNWLVCVFY